MLFYRYMPMNTKKVFFNLKKNHFLVFKISRGAISNDNQNYFDQNDSKS